MSGKTAAKSRAAARAVPAASAAPAAQAAPAPEARLLIVRVGADRYGLPLLEVRAVVDVVPPRVVPSRCAALRGLMPLEGHFVSLLHLGALIAGTAPPAAQGETAVVVHVAGVPMALEVEDVEEVVDRQAEFVGAAPVAWARGIWRYAGDLVTELDLEVLAGRISGNGGGDDPGR